MQNTVDFFRGKLDGTVSKEFKRKNDGIWMHFLANPRFVEDAREISFEPELRRTPEDDIVEQLTILNEEQVRQAIARGVTNQGELLRIYSNWARAYALGEAPKFTFLGIRLTTDCNLIRRCEYCDQRLVKNNVSLAKWKEILDEVTENGLRRGIYMSISGGEPLLEGGELYGKQGLIRRAANLGAVVNLNTNGHLITPYVAMSLIGSGLAKLHLSFDSPNPEIHNKLDGADTFPRVMEAIYSMQLAKAITDSPYPVLHINTVVTKRNLLTYDALVKSLLTQRRLVYDFSGGNTHTNPDLRDLMPHLIPVGGPSNARLRPSKEDWNYFLQETWPRASQIWIEFQASLGIPPERRSDFKDICFFGNPFTRVAHGASIDEVIESFCDGNYAVNAFSSFCFAQATQAYVYPNGEVYYCGSSSDCASPRSIGNVNKEGLSEMIKRDYLAASHPLPNLGDCSTCYGSTIAINQKVEKILREKIARLEQEVKR